MQLEAGLADILSTKVLKLTLVDCCETDQVEILAKPCCGPRSHGPKHAVVQVCGTINSGWSGTQQSQAHTQTFGWGDWFACERAGI